MVEAINTTNRDELWDQFNKFYNKNEKVIERCMKTDVRSIVLSEKVSDIEVQTDTFSATTKIVLDGLAGLEKIYPIIEAAVVAFRGVISLDMSRSGRNNDQKVTAIMLEMQNMMCAMFQLRNLKHTHVEESERDNEKSRLHTLIESITADIMACRSDFNYYLGRKYAFKLIRAKNFEQRFKTHVENFARRRLELQSTIANLMEEVHPNFEESLKENMLRFERLLTIQNDNYERVIARLDELEGYHQVTMARFDKIDKLLLPRHMRSKDYVR